MNFYKTVSSVGETLIIQVSIAVNPSNQRIDKGSRYLLDFIVWIPIETIKVPNWHRVFAFSAIERVRLKRALGLERVGEKAYLLLYASDLDPPQKGE